MRRLHLSALLILPALASTANAQAAGKGTGPMFPYSATTVAPARQQGSVTAGGLTWSCGGRRCTGSGPAAPAVTACTALARAVGTIRSYGRDGNTQLSAAQITECNAAASPARTTASASAAASGVGAETGRTTPSRLATGASSAAGEAVRAQPLRNQAGVRFTPPPPTDSATAAKMVILRGLGATVPAAAFGASIWLTPQRPYIDANTNLQVLGYGTSEPRYESTAELPFGSMTVIGSPRSGGWPLLFNFAAVPSRYYLFQCIVRDFTEYGYGFTNMSNRWTQAPSGHASFVIEPALEANRVVRLFGVGAERDRWTFGGCEITPFSP